MTIRRLRIKKTSPKTNTTDLKNREGVNSKRFGFRQTLMETLEPRQLMAVGPRLIGIQPNNSDLIENGVIRNIAPKELTFRFDDAQVLDAATTGGIRVSRAGGDGTFALPAVATDFGSDGRVDIQLTARNAGDFLTIQTTTSNLGPNQGPQFSIAGSTVSIVLNSTPGSLISAQQLVSAINSSSVLSSRLNAKINGGFASAELGSADPSRYVPVVMRSDNDVVIQPGAVIIGDRPNDNEVTLRFAENLPDDFYRLEVFGFDDPGRGIRGLRNTSGDYFIPTIAGTRQDTIEFRLDLGSKVTGVVPQPVVRNASGALVQQRDTIIVYFDNDKLTVENDQNGNPTFRSVENPEFYQLLYTSDTVRNTDDDVYFPVSVRYNASANTATLRFNDDIERLAGPFAPASTFRLRVGTRESQPIEPIRSEASAVAILDMNTGGAARVRFTSRILGEAGSGIQVNFVNSNSAVLTSPVVTVNNNVITVDLVRATTTVQQVVDAIEASAAANLVRTNLEPGSNGAFVVGNRPINYSATLYAMGDTFETSTNLGTIGSSSVPLTSLILTSDIEAEIHRLDNIGAANDVGQRVVPEAFENHINPAFTADNFDGIRTLYYNFRSDYAGLQNLSNSITDKQKERIREALALWSRQIGVQFIETANTGLTFALGETSVIPNNLVGFQVAGNSNFRVRIDPTYTQSLAIFSASNPWENEYAEGFTRSAAASIGLMLGLSFGGDLEPDSLLRMDNGFINFPTTADRNFEPIFPGTQDVIHGQYLHRNEGSDVDLYKFDIDFGPDGASREGVFVAETFAERSNNGSLLDTRLALYKQVQATATSNLGAGQNVEVEFTAVRSGKLGNNLQIFVTRSPRGANQPPLIEVFPNAIRIDLNSEAGSVTTLDGFLRALDENPIARSLVQVRKISGDGNTVLGSRNITYSPITLRGGRVDLIAQNDNYFSSDSLIRTNLDSGVYFVGVSSTGNDQYDPAVPNSGTGGRTQGRYDLRLTFRAQTDGGDAISDIGSGDESIALNGDADALAGGVYDYWFETRRQTRTMRFNSGGDISLEGKIITLTDADGNVRRFEYSSDTIVDTGNIRIPYSPNSTAIELASLTAEKINAFIPATAAGDTVTLRGERLLQLSPNLRQIDVLGKTIFVDKSAGPNADGSLEKPFNSISGIGVPNAFGATYPGDIVRIIANGGVDGQIASIQDNLAFEIGFGALAGVILSDGPTMDVPKGVNVMVDPGVIFKLNRSRIGVGSSTIGVDRSGGALQVLGAPILLDVNGNAVKTSDGRNAPGNVYFTSWFDESIGLDGFLPATTPSTGDWGGLVFKRDLDRSVGRFDLEDEGIFRQYVNYADIRFGGSNAVVVDSAQRTVNAIEIYDMRPTISFNRLTNNSGNAMLATPDSFEETLFSEPIYQRKGEFTPDYDRVGPHIHDNILLNNSINGLFISVSTPAGGSVRQLTVPGRFDDIDIVHVLSENLAVLGQPGASLLDQFSPLTNFVSLQATTGGILLPGTYNYKVTFVDRYGYETVPSNATNSVLLVQGQTAISVFGLPSVSGEYVSRRIYRSDSGGSGSYRLVAELDGNSTSFLDIGQQPGADDAILRRDQPNMAGVTVTAIGGASTLPIGTYTYRIVYIDAVGREGLASNPTGQVSTFNNLGAVRLSNLPPVPEGFVGRRIYRANLSGQYVLAAEVPASSGLYVDTGVTIGTPLAIESSGNIRPRLSASLTVDPGAVVKLEGARIELGHTAHMIAEGTIANRVAFTSKLDDRFGAGGTFDTNNNGFRPTGDASPGDWSGIYASPGSKLHLDHGVFAYAGGVSRIEGTLKAFSPVELQQADSRIAHITFENNANGMGGQGPIDRLGRPANENYPFGNNASRGSTLFIRGAQPVVLGNVFQNNSGTAITIDINSMDAKLRGDSGRQTGDVDRDLTLDANRGPLFRRNRLFNNSINGLEIRADATTNNRAEGTLAVRDLQRNSLSTESVWDDTDVVHVLFDSVTVSNLQHSGGLRLQSAINESLVIKMEGQGSNFDQERGTGFTATGRYSSIEGRVGGTIHVLGQPNFPVIFTSLRDDTVGAGTQPDGLPQKDTNNDGIATVPRPGDWRSLLFDTYSNDRNVRVAMERESANVVAPGINDIVITAQFLGALAPNPSKSDENLPLGYVIHGVISEPADQDVYSFTAEAGTEVWFDIDSTSSTLDSVLELLDANGGVLARSDNSTDEQINPTTIVRTALIDPFNVNALIQRNTPGARRTATGLLKDDGTTNEKDAGFRVLLPGVVGAQSTFFFRVRSRGTNVENSRDGLTNGSYSLQVRLRDTQEYAGSIVQHADIRYATNGVQANGLPSRSPLTGEAKVGMYDGTTFADSTVNSVYVGSVHQTDLQAISVAGTIVGSGGSNTIRFNVGKVPSLSVNPFTGQPLVNTNELVGSPSFNATFPIVLDVDYADGLNRPDLRLDLFDSFGNLIATNSQSTIFDDQPGPLRGSDLADLSRGSVGAGDPFIKIDLARGEYRLVVTSQAAFSGSGNYQLEIRAGDSNPNLLRGAFGTSINIAPGLVIPDRSILEMSDGANRIRFQFTYDGSFDFGNTPVRISGISSAAQIAQALRDAINSMFQQNRWRISAANSNGIVTGSAGNNSLLHLVGNVAFLSGASILGANAIIVSEGRGDVNVQRDQGQFLVTSTTVTNARDFAVWSAPADKQYADGLARQPHFIGDPNLLDYNYVTPPSLGGAYARNLPVLNEVPFGVGSGSVAERAGVTPGIVVSNNVFDSGGLGGLHIQGEPPVWQITAFPGRRDRGQNDNAYDAALGPDHSGSFIDDGDELIIDFQRQTVRFEFEDIAGGNTAGPVDGSGVVGGNGLSNWDRIPIYYREDTGTQYMRLPNTASGDATDDVIKQIHGSILGSPLVTNGTTQRLDAWAEPQEAPIFLGGDPADQLNFVNPTATLVLRGPQAITYRGRLGAQPFNIRRVGEYTAAPFVRAVNNTVIGNDGRASFNAVTVDSGANSTIATAIETWQGTGVNPQDYRINGTLPADPLSTGSSAVDLYKFRMEVGSRVLINVQTTVNLGAALRVFNSSGVAQDILPSSTGQGVSIDFTATEAGDYYLGISSVGNTGYDPLSFADRRRGSGSGNYQLTLQVLKPNNFLITVDSEASYADGETFTIEQVASLNGLGGTNSRTFEIVRGNGAPANGNIPVFIGPEHRVQDVARAIAAAINNADMNNVQNLPNGAFPRANPLAPVSAIAINGENGFDPTIALARNAPNGNRDVGVNSGAARGAELQAGLNRYRQTQNDFAPFDFTIVAINGSQHETGTHRGFGHDRTMSLPVFPANNVPTTSTGQGTTEKYVIVRNANAIRWNNRRVEGQQGGNNNLNQLLPETGIFVSGGASPTLMNNVFVNVQSPIIQERPSYPNPPLARVSQRPSAVIIAGATYQYAEGASQQTWIGIPLEGIPTNVPNTADDFNQTAGNNETLFVNVPGAQLLPGRGARIIDSSIDSLPEREGFRAVKQAVGISPSPVLAPDRDLNGVLRADDSTVAPPNGLGGNIFKDRGALERADFIGPTAIILNPIDNDAQQVDSDNTASVIDLTGGVYPEFRIQLKDGFENANLGGGTGINDVSVIGRSGGNRLPGSAVTITENGRLLVEGIDYVFSYDSTTDEIVLKPLAGIWRNDRVYDISLNNKNRFVIDASSGDLVGDGDVFTVRDSLGGAVTFEYDSGYRLQIPQGIQLQVPLAGGGAGGITDGDRFVVHTPTESRTFEFDSNGNSIAGQTPIPFSTLSTKRNIADAIVQALSTISSLRPRLLPNNDVFVGATAGISIDTINTPSMSQPNATLALRVPDLGTRPGGVTDSQTFGVSDGRISLVFEFDSDNNIVPGNVRIDISSASTPRDVAIAIDAALEASGLGVTTSIVGDNTVHLSLSNSGRVDLINTNLSLVGLSRALADQQSISITRTIPGGTVVTRIFEFTLDANVAQGSVPVLISTADTQAEIGVKLAAAIEGAAGLGLTPRHVGDGNVFVGGSSEHSISVVSAPTVGLFGRPGVRDNSTLEIFGTLLMQLPPRGGIDIPEDSTFTITANNRTVTFEFDSNFSGASLPNNVVVRYTPTITAADLVTNMLPIIRNAGLGINPRDAGGGRIDLGLLPTDAVNPLGSGIALTRGNVSDADVFTINNGTRTVSFEFENLSIGDGRTPSNTPIRYNNQSTRRDVLLAMKAAIESAGLGLSTEINSLGLRLLDNPRFTINVDNSPSLRLNGVPGGAIPVSFVQDQSFSVEDMRNAIIRSINKANLEGKTTLFAKARGGSTLFVENAVTISPDVSSFYLRGITDNADNFLKSNRINGETQFTILMPGIEKDYGDAPDPVTTTPGRYPTLREFDGARHVVIPNGVRFGNGVTTERNGRITPLSDGDADDDGISFRFQDLNMPLFNRAQENIITVNLSSPGFVDGWIDFNADGDWNDPGEQIINNVEFTSVNLAQTFSVRVPTTFPVPPTGLNSFARFRTSTAGKHLPTGLALDGEVEDYLVRIIPGVPPIGTRDVYTIDEDQIGGLVTSDPDGTMTQGFVVDDGVLANDVRVDGRPLKAEFISFGGNGRLIDAGGVQGLKDNGTFTFIPDQHFFGSTTIVYRPFIILDADRGEIIRAVDPVTATINVRPVNDAPTAVGFTLVTDKNTPISITQSDVFASTRANAQPGPANEANQTMTLSLPNNVSANSGSVSVVGGVLTYTPAPGFHGTDTFAFTVTDNGITGVLFDPKSVTRTITVNVRDKNEPPVTTPKSITMREDETYENAVNFFIAGDSPVEPGQTLTFSGVEITSMRGGAVEFRDGRVFYTPALNYNGPDEFYYFVTDDGQTNNVADPKTSRGTVSVSISPLNDQPVRTGSSMGTLNIDEDSNESTIDLTTKFSDPDIATNNDELTYRVVGTGHTSLIDVNFVGNNMFIRPRPDANGQVILTVEAKDTGNAFVTSNLTVTVAPQPDAPRLVTPIPNLNVNEDATIPGIVLSPTHFFDPDVANNGDVLSYRVDVSNPDLVDATVVNGQLVLNLKTDASGIANISVTARDSTGREISDSFEIVVAPVNDAPRLTTDQYLIPLGSQFTTTDVTGNQTTVTNDNGVLANDLDPERNPMRAVISVPPTLGTLTLRDDGTFTYRTNSNARVGDVDTFTYSAVDSLGAVSLSPTTVTITIAQRLPSPHQNPTNKLDVNADGSVSSIDVLFVVNFLNSRRSSGVPIGDLPAPPPYRDVNGDEVINSLDALEVVTFLNKRRRGGEGEGEGAFGSDSVFFAMTNQVPGAQFGTTTVLRENPNEGVLLDVPVVGPLPLKTLQSVPQMSLADYLASLEDEEEAIATVLSASVPEDTESLDAFFADNFLG